MQRLPPVEHFRSSSGVDIYRLPMMLFPNNFSGYAFVLEGVGPLTLVDTGSGMGRSNDDLLDGFRQLNEELRQILHAERYRTHHHLPWSYRPFWRLSLRQRSYGRRGGHPRTGSPRADEL